MTWEEVVKDASQRLDRAGIDDARTNVEYLASNVLGFHNRSDWRAAARNSVQWVHAAEFEQLILRRLAREPLQYILGEWEFFGLPLIVRSGVLIPRPETEIVVEEALLEAALMKKKLTIIDAGTGSGAIALALASKLPDVQIDGIDISEEAIAIARENQKMLQLKNIRFERHDMMTEGWIQEHVDIIVSNPPYVSLEDFNTLDPELRLFEPRKALTDEGSGYKFYERLASAANTSLAPNGRLVMELGYGMAENVREIILEASLSVLRVVPDLAGIPRVIVAGVRSQTDRGAVS